MTPKDLMSQKVREEFLIMVRDGDESTLDMGIAEVILNAFDLPVEVISHYYSKDDEDVEQIGRRTYPRSEIEFLLLKLPKAKRQALSILTKYGIKDLWTEGVANLGSMD
jgi:hypothetical protein